MAFKKKETSKDEKFRFSPGARAGFAKEMEKFGFDFDAFLRAKKAIVDVRGGIAVVKIEVEESRQSYRSKFFVNTPYFSLEAGTMDWFWEVPFAFWSELRAQSYAEESKRAFEVDRLEESRTGKPREERAREALAALTPGLAALFSLKRTETTQSHE